MDKIKNQLKQLDAPQLAVEIEKLRRELFTLRLATISSPIKDYKQFRKIKKNIARAQTYARQKQLQGK
jgi:ribosomal protein L29